MLDNNEYSSAIKHIDNSWSIYANNNERNTGYLVTRVWRVNQETKNSFVFTLFFHHFQVFIICISILSTYLIYFHRYDSRRSKIQTFSIIDLWFTLQLNLKKKEDLDLESRSIIDQIQFISIITSSLSSTSLWEERRIRIIVR